MRELGYGFALLALVMLMLHSCCTATVKEYDARQMNGEAKYRAREALK